MFLINYILKVLKNKISQRLKHFSGAWAMVDVPGSQL